MRGTNGTRPRLTLLQDRNASPEGAQLAGVGMFLVRGLVVVGVAVLD